MEMLRLNIQNKNPLVSEYIANKKSPFFHYSYSSINDDQLRYQEIMERVFPRKELSVHIRSFMEPFGLTEQIEVNLAKLEDTNSVVVIGGQQAGLLTGPLYSIHKILSIIHLAQEKERELGVPVVPVFWIAGEDHDIYEVNHVFTPKRHQLKKSVFRQKYMNDKKMISKVEFEKQELKQWYQDVMTTFGETNHSNRILEFLEEALVKTRTYTEFFVFITHELFKEYGLLLVDSANPDLRKIEGPFFYRLIQNGEEITHALMQQQEVIEKQGFTTAIDAAEDGMQLFYEKDDERLLLHYNKDEKQVFGTGIQFSKEDLLKIAEQNPQALSNNVVTRPLMQEMLFPTIAFIAGPGEIAYWAELKQVFELLEMKMPAIVPRLNITILERNVDDDLRELSITIEKAIIDGVAHELAQQIESLKDKDLEAFIQTTCEEIERKYQEAAKRVVEFDKGLEDICRKNSQNVQKQLTYLKAKVEDSIKLKNEVLLKKFDRIQMSLHPENGLQERCWNIFYFINHYGFGIIDDLMKQTYKFNGDHYVIKL